LDEEFHPRLADFGLVVVGYATEGGLTNTRSGAGTPYWMAPERLMSEPVNDRRTREADIYAYGCLCYAVCIAPSSNSLLSLYSMSDLLWLSSI
jgi:serine/threonine protein kinase